MSKRILVTSTDLMMIQFLVPHVIYLSQNGFEVDIACSNVGERINEIKEKLTGYIKAFHIVRLVRSPASLINIKGYNDMKKVIDNGDYDTIWTNEPVMGVVTRMAARKTRKQRTKVIYMVHGFHFYKGAPLLNWMIYYPVEKIASKYCDEIVVINHDDYKQAQKLYTKAIKYIHGIGVDVSRLDNKNNQTDIKKELGLSSNNRLIISVGELNENKNHQIIIKALSKLNNDNIHYILCGKGNQLNNLKELVRSLSLEKNVHFLGYRKDVVNLCHQSDIFAFPSLREGLGLAPLEAMYCGLPLITSDIRGPRDFMENGKTGYMCQADNEEEYVIAIKTLIDNDKKRKEFGKYNQEVVKPFYLDNVKKEVLTIITEI